MWLRRWLLAHCAGDGCRSRPGARVVKAGELDLASGANEHALGLDVTMNDPQRVQVAESDAQRPHRGPDHGWRPRATVLQPGIGIPHVRGGLHAKVNAGVAVVANEQDAVHEVVRVLHDPLHHKLFFTQAVHVPGVVRCVADLEVDLHIGTDGRDEPLTQEVVYHVGCGRVRGHSHSAAQGRGGLEEFTRRGTCEAGHVVPQMN